MKNNIIVALSILSLSSMASVLPKKAKMIRIGTTLSESKSIWAGDVAKSYGEDVKRSTISSNLLYSIGLGKGWQFDFNAVYSKAELEGGDLASGLPPVKEGESESGLSSISFTAKKRLTKRKNRKHSLVGEFGFAAPGSSNSFESEEMFLAINDGATKVFVGTSYGYKFSKMFSLSSQVKYIHKFESRKPDQLEANLGLSINFKKFGLIPFVNYLHSFDGVDIASDEFKSRSSDIRSDRFAFSQVNEKILGFGLNSYFVLNQRWVLDAFYQFTADGENTDKSKNFGLGFTRYF